MECFSNSDASFFFLNSFFFQGKYDFILLRFFFCSTFVVINMIHAIRKNNYKPRQFGLRSSCSISLVRVCDKKICNIHYSEPRYLWTLISLPITFLFQPKKKVQTKTQYQIGNAEVHTPQSDVNYQFKYSTKKVNSSNNMTKKREKQNEKKKKRVRQ